MLSGKKINHPYETGKLPLKVMLKERYIIMKKIAQGGMGAIYLAADSNKLGARWAVKEMSFAPLDNLPPAKRIEYRQKLLDSFRREFEILHKANHPNLPQAEDFFEEMGRPYIVMEYIEGKTLETILAEQPANTFLSEDRVVEWARQLCDVFDYLHSQIPPIIYRDLKPSNVMEDAHTHQIKLIDFGIARFYKPGSKKGDTIRFGTEGYLAPEVLSSVEQTNPATDIYSLGAMLHQMLTNREPSLTPFIFPSVVSINPKVSPRVEKAILKAVEANSEKRPQNAEAMLKELCGSSANFPRKGIPAKHKPGKKPAVPVPQSIPQHALPPGIQAPLVPIGGTALPGYPSSPQAVSQKVDFNYVHLGRVKKGQQARVGLITVNSIPNQAVTVNAEEGWIHVSPPYFISTSGPVQLRVEADTRQLSSGSVKPKPGSFLDRLPRLFKVYLGMHFQLIPGVECHRGKFFIRSGNDPPTAVDVEVEIRPYRFLAFMGWLLALGLFLLESLLMALPFVFLAVLLASG